MAGYFESTVKLTKTTDAARFAAGDYVAIYATTTGDVLPTELTRVTAATNGSVAIHVASPSKTGSSIIRRQLPLAWRWSRRWG